MIGRVNETSNNIDGDSLNRGGKILKMNNLLNEESK